MGWKKSIKKHMEDKKCGRVLNFDSALFYPDAKAGKKEYIYIYIYA